MTSSAWCVPGLLQTKEYARAVLRTAPTAGPAEDIDRQVALRMDRQATLDQQEPPDLWVVLSENVLRAQVGGPDVMRTQLGRLIDVAGQPTVTLQVLPLRAAAQVQPISPFTILEFPQAADPAVVYLEHLTGSLFLENADEVRALYSGVRSPPCRSARHGPIHRPDCAGGQGIQLISIVN